MSACTAFSRIIFTQVNSWILSGLKSWGICCCISTQQKTPSRRIKSFGGENVRWLGTDLIFWAMMIAFIFGSVGYYMLIFISGIEGIPQDLYEAATIDGANILDRFFQITLPLLKGVIRTCVTFWSINATTFFLWTKMFSPINTETATIVPVVYLYDTVFGGKGVVERDAGAGAAVGVVLTLIIIAVYVITNLILKDSDLEY